MILLGNNVKIIDCSRNGNSTAKARRPCRINAVG